VHPVQTLRLCTGRMAHRGSGGIALVFLDHGTRRGWAVSFTPRPLFNPGKTWYQLYRRLGGPQGRSGQVRKISPTPASDLWTFQPVAIRCTNWATRPKVVIKHLHKYEIRIGLRITYIYIYVCVCVCVTSQNRPRPLSLVNALGGKRLQWSSLRYMAECRYGSTYS